MSSAGLRGAHKTLARPKAPRRARVTSTTLHLEMSASWLWKLSACTEKPALASLLSSHRIFIGGGRAAS